MTVFLVCMCFFLIGLYSLYDSYMVYSDANDTSILKYKPEYDDGNVDYRDILDSMVAWVSVNGTTIDYPIMQGKDNAEFLNKDPMGNYSLSGSIFLDSRNDSKFTDTYSLVYGHHMEHGAMFGALDDYLDKKFFKTHRKGELIVGEKVYDIWFFAVVECPAEEDAVFAPTENEDTLPFIEKNHLYLDKKSMPKDGERYIGLSTCKYPDTTDRTIIFGVLTEKENTK